MSTLFNTTQNLEDPIGFPAFGRATLSPSKKCLEPIEDYHDPFHSLLDYSSGQIFGQPNEYNWENLQASNLSRGPSNFELPISKKMKVNHVDNQFQKLLSPQGYIMPSSTQSDTSHCLNTSSSNSFQVIGQSSFTSRSEESSINTTSNYDQSICSDSQNQIDQGLTKRKRGLKQESKTQLKKKELEKLQEQESKKTDKKKHKKDSQDSSKESSKNKKSSSNYNNETTLEELQRLTNKKREYLEEAINDKNGMFCYEEDPCEYKKARKRMQNRESAVRSRMRKRYYQDELEVRIQELEKIQKETSEQNAGLSAQNALLKKQLAYFEDVFAKSSLLGFDQVGGNVNRNDLEEFQKSLLRKINQRLYQDRQLDSIPESSLEIIPGSSNISSHLIDEGDNISTNSFSNENRLDSLRLVRSRSNSSSFSNTGYLFLAVVFCMMCCSSFLVSPQNVLKLATQTTSQFSKLIPQFDSGKKLMFKSPYGKDKDQQMNLASPLDEDVVMEYQEDEPLIGAVSIVKMLLSGEYTYLTYMILSSTCFFFWLMPNCHKIRSLFYPFRSQSQTSSKRRYNSKPNSGERQVLTRSQCKAMPSYR